jgi:hypothetical protein
MTEHHSVRRDRTSKTLCYVKESKCKKTIVSFCLHEIPTKDKFVDKSAVIWADLWGELGTDCKRTHEKFEEMMEM